MMSERFPRNREKWSPAEEQQLLALYEDAEAHPERKYFWCGKWRTRPVYHVAAKLGRSPCAVAGRRYALVSCQRRRECVPTMEQRRIVLGSIG